METETDYTEQAPQTHLEMQPIKEATDALCQAIVGQEKFAELHQKIETFITNEKLRYEYDMLNQRGALLQQKSEAGMEIDEKELAEFEKLRTELLANKTMTDFQDVQDEVQQVQDRIHQVIAKTFEVGKVPSQDDFDFCSDGFGDCGCSN